MKKNSFVFGMVFLSFFLFASLAFGQNIQTYQIPLRSGTVELQKGTFDGSGGRYVIVQFEKTLKRDQIEALRSLGISPLALIYRGAWLCAVVPGAMSDEVRERFAITASAPWAAEYRISPKLLKGEFQEWARTADGRVKLLVTFFDDVGPPEMAQALGKYDPRYALSKAPVTWAIRIAPSAIPNLMAEPGIFWIEEGPKPFQPLNDTSRSILRVNPVQDVNLSVTPPLYGGLSGHGVNIAVSESVYTDHPDFWDHDAAGNPTHLRFLNMDGGVFHGTHVAGIIGGNGWNSARGGNTGTPYQWRGMAPEVTLISGNGYGSFPVDASNHSYTMDYGEYGTDAWNVDRDIRRGNGFERRRPHIWAAGNQGALAQYDNEEGYYSIYSPAKNSICVGSVNASDGALSDFSSLGPTFDGRIKPDVMAPGGDDTTPKDFNWDKPLTVEIDYIRIQDGSGQIVKSWEFNRDGDPEGWFQKEARDITNPRVSSGLLSFEAKVGSFGFVDDLALETAEDDVIEMRYRIVSPYKNFIYKGMFKWKVNGSSDDVDGKIAYKVDVDNAFHVVRVPVGERGFLLGPGDKFEVSGMDGWTGTIDRLRIDPISGSFGIISTLANTNTYMDACGTSMAAPATTGVVALMLQQFLEKGKWVDEDWEEVDLDVNPPLPSTIKAVLIQTATDMVHTTADPKNGNNPDTGSPVLYHEGPDFATGYGLVNAQAAVELIAAAAANRHIHEAYMLDGIHEYEFTLSSSITEIKVTLAWDDVEGSAVVKQTIPRLVNDLDLVLIDPSGNRHYPWTLNPLPVADCGGDGPGCGDPDPIKPEDIEPAFKGEDHLNNVEQVHVKSPQAGTWRVQVNGDGIQDVTDGRQSYSLVSSVPLVRKFTDPTKPIIPIIEYVNEVDGTYTVYFGYDNPNAYVVVVELGEDNKVNYMGQGVLPDQISIFQPGRNIGVFSMDFDGSELKWTLNGTTISTTNSEVKHLRITPLLNRVVNHCDGTYTATFGYVSPHPFSVVIEHGFLNELKPSGTLYSWKGPVTEFEPGTVQEAFKVDFDGKDLVWNLDGQKAVARGSMAANICPEFRLYKAFAFGADTFTRTVPNAPSARYIKIVQNGANFRYDPSRGYGYVDTRAIDETPNNRGILSGDDEIYDQFIGVKTKIDQNSPYSMPEIVFRIDVPDGIYRFVAAGGDPQYGNHSTTICVSTGQYRSRSQVTLVEGKKPAANTFFRVGFDGKIPPRGDGSGVQPKFLPVETSPYLRVPSPYDYFYGGEESGPPGNHILVHQIAGITDPGWAIGGDLCLLEIWYIPDTRSVTEGEVQGTLVRNAGVQTFEVTETGVWRKAERYYGLKGIDEIWPMKDACGVTRTFAVGWHQEDLAEYLMEFGGEYNRLVLRGKAARPAPVVVDILIDGEVRGRTAWTAGSDCSQDISVVIPGVDYGTHAIAVRFMNDKYDPQNKIDRNLYLEALLVPEPTDLPSVTHGLPKGQFCAWGRCYNAFQSDEVTPVNTWRSADRFYGHQGMDQIEPLMDGCGKPYTYAVGWHQDDLIEYLMKIGGEYNHLVLRGIADRPGPVDIEIWIDGELNTTASWDGDNNATQDIDIQIKWIPYGTHAVAVKFARDDWTPGGGADKDLNLYLSALKVSRFGVIKILSDETWKSNDHYVEGWERTDFSGDQWRNAYAPYPNQTPPSNWICGTEALFIWDYRYSRTPNGKDGPTDAWFRNTIYVYADPWEIETAVIDVGADDDFELYVNGTKVLEDWNGNLRDTPFRKDIKPYLVKGQNVLAIHARDSYGIYEWLLVDGTVE